MNKFKLSNLNVALIIFSLGFVVYFQTLFFGFTYLDDNVLILDNLFFLKNLGNIFNAFKLEVFHILHSSAAYYRPILTISFILDAQLSGESAFFYHFTNVFIHLIASFGVFLFFTSIGYKRVLSFSAGLLFLVHPVLVQAVAWIPGRNDSLLCLFVIYSFYFLIRYLEESKSRFLILYFLFYFFSIFTKESAVLFPVAAVLYLIILRKEKIFSDNIVKIFSGTFFIFLVWIYLRSAALVNPVRYDLATSLTAVFKNQLAILLYMGKIFLPVNLTTLPVLSDSNLLIGLFTTSIFLVISLYFGRKSLGTVFFGYFWFLLFLLPSFIRPNTEYVSDFIEHRVYLPILGVFWVLLEVYRLNEKKIYPKIAKAVLCVLVFVFTIITLIHSRNYINGISFWEKAALDSPSHPLAHKNLGAMYYLNNDLEKAEESFLKALEVYEHEKMVHNNLALIYMKRGEIEKAVLEFERELEINPYYDNAYYNYGNLYYSKGELERAFEMWSRALQINPDHTGALRNILGYYMEKEDYEKAQYYYNELIRRGVKLQ